MATKVTFKKQPKPKGLAAAGYSERSIDCMINRKTFGTIAAPTWQDSENKWSVSATIVKPAPDNNPNCEWKWIRFKLKHDTAEAAKEWLQNNIDLIRTKYTLWLTQDAV